MKIINIKLDSAPWFSCLLHMLSLKDIFESDSLEHHQMKMNLKEKKMTDSKIVPKTSCQFIFWRLPKLNRRTSRIFYQTDILEWKLNEVWCQTQALWQYVHLNTVKPPLFLVGNALQWCWFGSFKRPLKILPMFGSFLHLGW